MQGRPSPWVLVVWKDVMVVGGQWQAGLGQGQRFVPSQTVSSGEDWGERDHPRAAQSG